MNKPEKVQDVWPHTETVLFLTDSEKCFGTPIKGLMNEISSCNHLSNSGLHQDNDLSADCHRFGRERIKDVQEIVPNSLLFLHCDLVIETELEVYIRDYSIPRSSHIVVLIESSTYSDAERRIGNITRSIETAFKEEDVLEEAERYFTRICPECQGDPARNWVLNWQQQVYNKVHN